MSSDVRRLLVGQWAVLPGSVWRGIRAMRRDRDRASVNVALRIEPSGNSHWGLHAWTPVWHEGRGPYVSLRLGRIGFYRGY